MRFVRTLIVPPLVGMAILAGCRQDADSVEPNPALAARGEPVANQDLYNYAALETFPQQVRLAFERDYPSSAISQAQVQSVQSGPVLYKIVFIQNGQPQTVLYDRAGVVVTPPAPTPNTTITGNAARENAPAPPPPAPNSVR